MLTRVLRLVVMGLALLPLAAAAEPITLKLSFFTSDRSVIYLAAIKPFVDAVNRDGSGVLHIDVYPSGTLGRVQSELPQLLLNGGADIAFVVPGQTPDRFADEAAIELPGLFRDVREATSVYTRMMAAGALRGYDDFFVIAAFATDPETFHSRKRLTSLAELKGQKFRTNNPTSSETVKALGALPILLALNDTNPAIGSGAVDGACVALAQLFDVGIGRLTSNHFLLPTTSAPLTLLMPRKLFDRLPENARDLIVKYSGDWAAARYIETVEENDKEVLRQIQGDPRRVVAYPSAEDLKTAQATFKSIRDTWAAASPRNAALLARLDAELAKLRADK